MKTFQEYITESVMSIEDARKQMAHHEAQQAKHEDAYMNGDGNDNAHKTAAGLHGLAVDNLSDLIRNQKVSPIGNPGHRQSCRTAQSRANDSIRKANLATNEANK